MQNDIHTFSSLGISIGLCSDPLLHPVPRGLSLNFLEKYGVKIMGTLISSAFQRSETYANVDFFDFKRSGVLVTPEDSEFAKLLLTRLPHETSRSNCFTF